MSNIQEIWKDIPGFEGFYQVSNLANIRSIDRPITLKNGTQRFVKGYPIINRQYSKGGYCHVNLVKNRKAKLAVVHRLVATAFIPNPENKETVNHKDCNKKNNLLSNLEWMTMEENFQHAYENGLISYSRLKKYEFEKVIEMIREGKKDREISEVFNKTPASINVIRHKLKRGFYKNITGTELTYTEK